MTNTISRHDGINLGGVHQILWTFVEDVLSATFHKSNLLYIVNLKSGKSWNYLYTTPETIKVESEEKQTPAGIRYIYTVKALIPKDRSNVELILYQLQNRGLILKVLDKNGVTRVFGFPANPMKKTSKLTKSKEYEGFNGWEITFKGEFETPAGYALTMQNVIPIGVDPGGGASPL